MILQSEESFGYNCIKGFFYGYDEETIDAIKLEILELLQQDGSNRFSGFENIKHIKDESIKALIAGYLKRCCKTKNN